MARKRRRFTAAFKGRVALQRTSRARHAADDPGLPGREGARPRRRDGRSPSRRPGGPAADADATARCPRRRSPGRRGQAPRPLGRGPQARRGGK